MVDEVLFDFFFAAMVSSFMGRVAGSVSVDEGAFGEVVFWWTVMFFFVLFAFETMGEVARRVPWGHGTGFALGDRLRKAECEVRHQGDQDEMKTHDG